MLSADNVRVLVEVSLTTAPAPEIAPEIVCPVLDEYLNVDPFEMLIAPAYDPVPRLPSEPMTTSPDEMVVAPA